MTSSSYRSSSICRRPSPLTASLPTCSASRYISTTRPKLSPPPSPPPKTHDRGPKSEEKTQTDFSILNVLGDTPPPTTAIDACLSDGFHLDNGVKISGGSGVLLVGGEAFGWQPWEASSGPTRGDKQSSMVNAKGQWDVEKTAWGVLEMGWPKPGM